ncbi:MAG: tetratricopeptide repeat protein [Candidatus Sericytochromatia bacterium]|nr:tetratricopeptide repeat protein [Candidatus Sericytochromatia bacterium]
MCQWLGTALVCLGEGEEAIPHLQRATTLDPKLVDAWTNLGTVLAEQNQPEEAEICFMRSLALHEDIDVRDRLSKLLPHSADAAASM